MDKLRESDHKTPVLYRYPAIRILTLLIVVIFVVHLALDAELTEIMAALPSFVKALAENFVLIAVLYPALHFLVYRPLIRRIAQQERAEHEQARLLDILQQQNEQLAAQNEELQAQSEEIQAQNEEMQAQSEEIRAQNDELAGHQRELESKNLEIDQANHELERLYELSQHQEARARAIVEATADGILVVDGQQKVIAVNPALESLTGYSAEDLLGRTCQHLLDERKDDGECLCDSTCPFLHPPGGAPSSVDATVITRDGRQVWVNVAYGPIYGLDGRPTTVVHAIRDISTRKEVEHLKDEFLGMVAHDLRTPLTSIRGYAQLLHRQASEEQSQATTTQRLEVIDRQSERMLDLVNRLLDVTRIQMGRLELHLEPTDLGLLTERVVEATQTTTERHRLVLYKESHLFRGQWDSTYLERVLGNLMDNAVKYTPAGGAITVRLQGARTVEGSAVWPGDLAPCPPGDAPGWAVVSVLDQGVGIAPDEQARLFERYYRTAGGRTTASGLGLGLYISKGVIEAHGGSIWVESEQGEGSTFCFALPLA